MFERSFLLVFIQSGSITALCAWHSQRVMVEEENLLAHATLSADRDRWQVQSLSRCNCCMLHFAFSCCSRFVFALFH